MEGRLILVLVVCLALTEYGLGRGIVTRVGVVCPSIQCRNCPFGYVTAELENGCPACPKCKIGVQVCPSIQCPITCPFGYVTAELENGCPACPKCKIVPCPLIGCINPCPSGYVRDENGCPTCQCKGAVACPLIGCINHCPFGYVRDEKGCPTCQCKIIKILKELLKCRKKFCTMEYAPVCGSDGKTYSNICLLNAADCKSEEDIAIVHPGPCSR